MEVVLVRALPMGPVVTWLLCAFLVDGGLIVPAPAFAQAPPPPPPPVLEPLPEPQPAPPEIANDPDIEPQVTVIRRERETVEEYRLGGRLVWVKVSPRIGPVYYLVPEGPNGAFVRRDSLDSGLRVPMWLIFTF
jgi:hypothetical protein